MQSITSLSPTCKIRKLHFHRSFSPEVTLGCGAFNTPLNTMAVFRDKVIFICGIVFSHSSCNIYLIHVCLLDSNTLNTVLRYCSQCLTWLFYSHCYHTAQKTIGKLEEWTSDLETRDFQSPFNPHHSCNHKTLATEWTETVKEQATTHSGWVGRGRFVRIMLVERVVSHQLLPHPIRTWTWHTSNSNITAKPL